MSSADILAGAATFDLASVYQGVQDQKKQLAQYAIVQAANFMSDGKNDQALQSFKKAVALDPNSAVAYTYVGKISLSQGKNADAIKAFQQVVRIQSDATTANDTSTNSSVPTIREAHINLGNAYVQDKQYDKSEKEFKTASRLNRQDPVADYTLGQQYLAQGRLDEAETQFLKVQKISPKDGNVYYALGQTYNKMGKYDLAATNLEKALTLKSDFAAANYELGVAYSNLNKTDDAKDQLSILKSKDTSLAAQLNFVLNKPQILSMNTKNSGGFIDILGPGTPLWMLDPTHLTSANSSKTFNITFQFSNDMDMASVTNTQNWSLSRANSAQAGYYNNTLPATYKEATLPTNPERVIYNPLTHEATITIRLNQNATGDATIDPSHIVFKFNGKDAAGRDMEQAANEIDGFRLVSF